MSIVAEDQQSVIQYLQKMSKVFRYVLENRDLQLVELKSEMEFIQNYIFLQKERFRSNFQIHISVNEQLMHHFIIPLSLQILFENVFKHNIVSEKRPLTIEMYNEGNDYLVLKNT